MATAPVFETTAEMRFVYAVLQADPPGLDWDGVHEQRGLDAVACSGPESAHSHDFGGDHGVSDT